jgi:hypothetical protein
LKGSTHVPWNLFGGSYLNTLKVRELEVLKWQDKDEDREVLLVFGITKICA